MGAHDTTAAEPMERGAAEQLLRQRLAHLHPLNQLPQDVLSRLLPALLIEPCPAGTTLYDAGDSPSDNFYLLQGALCLYDTDGTPQLKIRPEPHESMPLPFDLPSAERGEVVEDSILLRVERTLLQQAVGRRGAFATAGGVPVPAAAPAEIAEAPLPQAAPETPVPAPPRSRRVLLVEHQAEQAERTRALLKSLGLRSDWARSAEEAVELLGLEEYGAVLLDLQLPDGDALDVVARARALGNPVPRIVAVTDAAHYDPEGCLTAGMDDACCWPLDAGALHGKLALGSPGRISA